MEPAAINTQQPEPASGARRVFLVGYRGTGKSTVARLLAKRSGWQAIDADDAIELAAGKTIAEIFAEQGEPHFRELEQRVVFDLCGRDRTIVALGGGAVLREWTRERLVESGPVVWLTASAETLVKRIANDDTSAERRPSLTDLPPEEEVRRLLTDRGPVYRACATLEVSTENRSPIEIADEIASRIVLD